MDEFDRRILELVQRDNRLSAQRLSELVNLSPSACHRRLQQLRADGIIEADVSVVSPKLAGYGLMFIVEVTLEKEHTGAVAEFKRSMIDTDEVLHCYYLTGAADFLLVVIANDTESYEAFTHKFFFENRNIHRFNTRLVLQRVKSTAAIPIRLE